MKGILGIPNLVTGRLRLNKSKTSATSETKPDAGRRILLPPRNWKPVAPAAVAPVLLKAAAPVRQTPAHQEPIRLMLVGEHNGPRQR